MSDYRAKYLKYKEKYLKLKIIENKINKLEKGELKNRTFIMNGGGSEKIDVYLFKADWCGHCKIFKPTWKTLSKKYAKKYNFHTMDSSKNSKEIEEWGIRGFPTIIARKGKLASEYAGPRDEESILLFLKQIENN